MSRFHPYIQGIFDIALVVSVFLLVSVLLLAFGFQYFSQLFLVVVVIAVEVVDMRFFLFEQKMFEIEHLEVNNVFYLKESTSQAIERVQKVVN